MYPRLKATTAAALVALTTLLAACIPASEETSEPAAKLSRNNICHVRGTGSYNQTVHYTPYASLEACLQHGRLPAGNTNAAPPPPAAIPPYDRDAFGGWVDVDGDCVNTRHEVLQSLSTGLVEMRNSCSVGKGRWLDPYTNQVFTEAADLDIDHLVPLAYAWARGAHAWSKDKRVQFSNDPANLFAVQAAVNRAKGAMGPTEWLPPEVSFRCQYILRFQRVVASYDLVLPPAEAAQIQEIRAHYC